MTEPEPQDFELRKLSAAQVKCSAAPQCALTALGVLCCNMLRLWRGFLRRLTTSSSVSKRYSGATGPKVSSCVQSISAWQPLSTVGSKNSGPAPCAPPPSSTDAPFDTASAMCSSTCRSKQRQARMPRHV